MFFFLSRKFFWGGLIICGDFGYLGLGSYSLSRACYCSSDSRAWIWFSESGEILVLSESGEILVLSESGEILVLSEYGKPSSSKSGYSIAYSESGAQVVWRIWASSLL